MTFKRSDGRKENELRPIEIKRDFLKHPEGSVLIEMGETKVICTASVEEEVPKWMQKSGTPGGWVTAEYGMLPRATSTRNSRAKNLESGRTMEIQRLIGRSLRAAVDLKDLGKRTIWLDCDVIQADGGTRTAAISGAFAALVEALKKLKKKGLLKRWPIKEFVAAVSVGVVDGKMLLDLNYEEDSRAEVDMNIVMTGKGEFVELQATAERGTWDTQKLNQLIGLGSRGIHEILKIQKRIVGSL